MSAFDDLLARLGMGRWNAMFFLAEGYWKMHLVANVLAGPFVAPALQHTCLPPDHGYTLTSTTFTPSSIATTTTNNNIIPTIPANKTTETYCHYFSNDTFAKEDCTSWEYDNSTFALTLTSQFNLVCSSEYLRAAYQSIYMLGYFFGAPINGLTSDRFGRRSTLTLGVLTYFSLALSSCWLTSLPAILASRFILGFIHPSVLQTGYILTMEVCQPQYRSVLGILLSFPWALGTMAWGGVAYLIRDWRWLQLTVNLPALLIFPILWFLDESPRWLIVHGKFDEASKVLDKASRWNKTTLPPHEELHSLMQTIRQDSYKAKPGSVEKEEEGTSTYKQKAKKVLYHLFILFRHPKLRLITCVMSLKAFLVALIFYGMTLNAVNYSADPYLFMVLSGLVEVPAYIIIMPVVAKLGRKWPSVVLYSVSGVVILSIAFIPKDMKVLVMVLVLVGRLCISAIYSILYLYMMELFPTQVRLQGIGYCTIFSRIGSMISPFITEMLGPLYPSAPSLVFGLGALVAGVATLPLHETLGKKLPDTIADLDHTPVEFISLEERTGGGEEREREAEAEDQAAMLEESELAKLRA